MFASRSDAMDTFNGTLHNKVFPLVKEFFYDKDLSETVFELEIKEFPKGWNGIAYYRQVPDN